MAMQASLVACTVMVLYLQLVRFLVLAIELVVKEAVLAWWDSFHATEKAPNL